MPFIALLGCDGSGKSAVISQVTMNFRAAGSSVICGHWRPTAVSGKSADSLAAAAPHGKPPHGPVKSILKLGWLWFNWWLGWWKELRGASRCGLVLFDRFHGDLLIDPLRYRYGGAIWLAKLASQLMPQPDLILFLDAPPEVLLARKQEVSHEALERSRKRYLQFGKRHRQFLLIDVNRPLEDVVEDVMSQINAVRGAK